MKFLKCTGSSASDNFTKGKLYPLTNGLREYNGHRDCVHYQTSDNHGKVQIVPLNGHVWQFEVVNMIKSEPKPRFHRPRQTPPKRSVTTAKIYYVDGSTYTIKHVDKVACYGSKVTLFGHKEVADGIEESVLTKIDARHLGNIVITSPTQVTQIEKNFNHPDKWNLHRENERIYLAAQIDIKV